MRRWLVAAIPFTGFAPTALAQMLPDQHVQLGPGAQGLAGAFTAVADDPTAIIYNPAGLTQISPAKRSLSYNAYSKMSYRAGKILFGSDVEFNADNFPFFVGTTYRHPEILSDWTFAFGAFDNGSYSIRTKWEVAGKTEWPTWTDAGVTTQTIDASYTQVQTSSGSALSVGAAAARETSLGSLGMSLVLRNDREGGQTYNESVFGPLPMQYTEEKVYTRNSSNREDESNALGAELRLGWLAKWGPDWSFGLSISQLIYGYQRYDARGRSHSYHVNEDGQGVLIDVNGQKVALAPFYDRDHETHDKPFGSPPFRYRIGARYNAFNSTFLSADLIGRGYGTFSENFTDEKIRPGIDGALGLQTGTTFVGRFGFHTGWDPTHVLSSRGFKRQETYTDIYGLTAVVSYKLENWSGDIGITHQRGTGKMAGQVGAEDNKVNMVMNTISASLTSDQ